MSTPPLLGISGSDFSTLDLVSVLASLLFMVEAEKKKEMVPVPILKADGVEARGDSIHFRHAVEIFMAYDIDTKNMLLWSGVWFMTLTPKMVWGRDFYGL